jgi:hypothetical protein
VNGRE